MIAPPKRNEIVRHADARNTHANIFNAQKIHAPQLYARHKGVVTIMVIWAIAIASIVVAATQILAFREATIGRECISRVQARWAARAGVETMIAIM